MTAIVCGNWGRSVEVWMDIDALRTASAVWTPGWWHGQHKQATRGQRGEDGAHRPANVVQHGMWNSKTASEQMYLGDGGMTDRHVWVGDGVGQDVVWTSQGVWVG